MKIAIHKNDTLYTKYWIEYCEKNKIQYVLVNAYDTNIVEQVKDCDIFMWYFSHASYQDVLFAKQLIFSLKQMGKIVFPNSKTCWHFDDKLGQKYLFEAMNIQAARGYAFYDKDSALQWAKVQEYPKVFKLRGGAGSSNVMLVENFGEAERYINKSFKKGFKSFRPKDSLKNILILYKDGRATVRNIFGALHRWFCCPYNLQMLPIQKGYVYFQEFIPMIDLIIE